MTHGLVGGRNSDPANTMTMNMLRQGETINGSIAAHEQFSTQFLQLQRTQVSQN
jgi:hypothetical protein